MNRKLIDRRLWANISALFMAVSVSTINQVVTSGTNFLLGLYLVRVLTVGEFGVFGVIQAISFVLAGFGNAVFLTQMVVNYPDKDVNERTGYVTSVFSLIALLGAALIFTSLIVLTVSKIVFEIEFEFATRTFSAIVFAAGFLLKEFYCRLAYTQRREVRALRINLVIAFSLLLLIAVLRYFQVPISAHSILYCYAISATIGVVIGQLEVRLPLQLDSKRIRSSMKDVWAGGKWALASDVLLSARQQAHVFITAAVAGPVGVGMINAAKIFITPVLLLTPAFSQIYIVRLVSLRQTEPLKLLRYGVQFSALNVACVLIYGLVLYFSFAQLTEIILTDSFPDIGPIVLAWFAAALFIAARYGLEIIQKAMKKFRSLAIINIPVTVIALGSVYLLLISIGPVGAVYGLAFAEMILALILARMVLLSSKKIGLLAAKS